MISKDPTKMDIMFTDKLVAGKESMVTVSLWNEPVGDSGIKTMAEFKIVPQIDEETAIRLGQKALWLFNPEEKSVSDEIVISCEPIKKGDGQYSPKNKKNGSDSAREAEIATSITIESGVSNLEELRNDFYFSDLEGDETVEQIINLQLLLDKTQQ